MNKKACSFTGHRIIPEYDLIREKLKTTLIELIRNGYTVFYNGGAIGFDTYCALELIALKEKYDIELNMVLPCKDQDIKWTKAQRDTYKYILEKSDNIEYVSDTYTGGCMQKRNLLLCEKCDLLLAYLQRSYGGTYFTVNYARKLNKDIVNLANI